MATAVLEGDQERQGVAIETRSRQMTFKRSPKTVQRDWLEANSRRQERELDWKLQLNEHQFERIWRQAHGEGGEAMSTAKEGGGYCFVHVRIADGLFASWLVKTGKAKVSADMGGNQAAVRVFIAKRDVGDCNRLEAYAKAFTMVLIKSGIDAYDESRLD
jgi:hypothetical protein